MYCLLCFWHSSYKRLNWCTWIICTVTEGGGEWGTKKKKKEERLRERENHSPSTVGKANDLSQPLLSPRLAERKLPAVPHAFVTDYNLLKISTRNTHRKKIWLHMSAIAAAEQLFKRKKEREKKELLKKKKERRNRIRTVGSEIAARCVTDYSTEKLAVAGEIYAYIAFPLVSLPHFLVRLLLCFSNNVVTFECCSLLCSSFLEGCFLFRMFSIAVILWFLLGMKRNSSVSSAKR